MIYAEKDMFRATAKLETCQGVWILIVVLGVVIGFFIRCNAISSSMTTIDHSVYCLTLGVNSLSLGTLHRASPGIDYVYWMGLKEVKRMEQLFHTCNTRGTPTDQSVILI